ncbi:MAG TPA: gluconate 2-dehydrogenase subunit 3 family protein [Caldimonas sp.]|nr:gluconate 2-dehydrogenase subunit 3 family protein [Caldimonas sp.]
MRRSPPIPPTTATADVRALSPGGLTRRAWIGVIGALGAVAAWPGWLLSRADAAMPDTPRPVVDERYDHLLPAEIAFLDAATSRLIPADDLGPSAAEAGVTVFIDRQLAGAFGGAARWYMQGPWHDGSEQQGYQVHATPAQLYREAIRAIDAHCRATESAAFAALPAARQDALLRALEKGQLQLPAVHGKAFFAMLWQNTQEGYFADPMYGGNRGFVGWRLVGFPGPRYNYVEAIRRFGQPYDEPPVGVLGRDWRRRQPGMT